MTIGNSVSKADAGGTRTGDDLKAKKALLEVRCPQFKKWVGLYMGRSRGVESEPRVTWYIAHSQSECPELPQYRKPRLRGATFEVGSPLDLKETAPFEGTPRTQELATRG